MALQQLRDWFKFQIWPQAGGTTPELRDLSEIRQWLIDTANDPELLASILGLQEQVGSYDPEVTGSTITADLKEANDMLRAPLVAEKLAAVISREDTQYEILSNKILIDPIINDTGTSASVTFSSEDTSDCYAILMKAFGISGNNYYLTITESGVSTEAAVSIEGTEIVITLSTDADEDSNMTFADLEKLLNADSNFTSIAIVATVIHGHADEYVKGKTRTKFSGGALGSRYGGTSTDLSNIISLYHKDKLDATAAPGASNDGTEDYSVGSRWYDTVAKEWYICTDATKDNATWEDVVKAPTASEAPTMAVAAEGSITLDTGISLDFTAKTAGTAGNSISVELVDPEELNETIDVSVDGTTITVLLASDGTDITSTAANVKTAIDGTPSAAALISVAITGADSTLAIEGTETLESGVDGTTAPAGKMVMDSANGKLWIAFSECTTSNSDGWVSFSKDA